MMITRKTDFMTPGWKEIVTALDRNDLHYLRANIDKFNANLRIQEEDNDTLLMHALAFSSREVSYFLIEHGASLGDKNSLGETVIHSIVYSGNPDILTEIYEQYKCDLNAQSGDGTTPLILSAGLEKWDVFERLIQLGADVNICDYEGNAPIHLCCSIGNKEAVDLLVSKGANLSVKTQRGNLPMALAVNENHTEIVKYLFFKIYT